MLASMAEILREKKPVRDRCTCQDLPRLQTINNRTPEIIISSANNDCRVHRRDATFN